MTEATRASEAATTGGAGARPTFSIVSAVYNVAPYLPDFIASIEAQQRFPLDELEVIAVDDGSTDESLALLREWADRAPFPVTVLHQPNAGQAAARNLGLDRATGAWVTFTDPDDALDPDYLFALDRFARTHSDIDVLVPRVVTWDDARDRIYNRHPRRWQMAKGTRVVDLTREPNVFSTATVAAFRLDRIRRHRIRFDPRIRPAFEDAHFTASFVLTLDRPRLGLVRGARYRYRRREALSSSTQTAWSDPNRFTVVFRHGYLDLLHRSRRGDGRPPAWVQQLVVYELMSMLAEHDQPSTRLRVPADVADEFLALFAATTSLLDEEVVRSHRVRPVRAEWVDVIVHGSSPEPWHSPYAVETRVDRLMRLRRVTYAYTGPKPVETVLRNGQSFAPPWTKDVAKPYFGSIQLRERVMWLPIEDGIEIRIAGRSLPVRRARPTPVVPKYRRRPKRRRTKLFRYLNGRALREWPTEHPDALLDFTQRLRRRIFGWRRFRDAWVVMDRIHNADDNGERLFEYLRRYRRDINAWFVIEAGTPDWARLRRRYGRRVIAYGSETWRSLLLNASWLISSHSDRPVLMPAPVLRLTNGVAPWKLAFLQHGVTKNDISQWLNNYPHDFIAASTGAELHSFVDDGTRYAATAKEVHLTGMPRFDALLRTAATLPADKRDLVLVAPTWRNWLALPLLAGSQRRQVRSMFWESEYLAAWMRLLADPTLADAARKHHRRLAFLPHPNIQDVLNQLPLPDHVVPISFADGDIQRVFARIALYVTDYSSVTFDAAYIDRPSVYYQFDRDRVLHGAHVGRAGYFDYERDGFGPVTTTHDDAVAAIAAAIEHGPVPAEPWATRIAETFPLRDGRASQRVVTAIEELSRPWRG